MARTLDRSRDFGTITGGDDGATFVQDEILFDALGNELVADAPQEPKRRGRQPKAIVTDVDAQLEANLSNE